MIDHLSSRVGALVLCTVAAACVAQGASPTVSFNRDIRPIMSDTCFRCHGPDKSSRMAGMRLDLREQALQPNKTGVAPIVPGDPEHSLIIQRIFATSKAKIMPPVFAHKELTQTQKETIRRWVAEGAKYEGHWAWQPIKRPEVPVAPGAGGNPIDAFIQSRLTTEGLQPAAEADRVTLIRRVTFDLTGLPPTPVDVRAFVNDKASDAYEKLVDRLLGSPRYAEKQAMHWLDAVRYADTSGFHGDNPWPAWPYRDYMLRAYRDNKPFDEFTREQLAGDLIPNATLEQKVASAYNRMNRTSGEGGLQPKEYLAKYGADRVRTLSSVWLGMTMGCAECHDHKFDPILTKDFYSMKAFFADIKETGLVLPTGPMAFGSKLSLPTAEQTARLLELKDKLASAKSELEEQTKALDARRGEWAQELFKRYNAGELAWQYQHPVGAQAQNGAKLTVYNDEPVDSNFYIVDKGGATLATERAPGDGLVVASGPNPDNETYTISIKPGAGLWTALGIEVVQDESLSGVRLSRGADRFVLTEVEAELNGEKLPFALATVDPFNESAEHPALAAIDGNPQTGWGVDTGEGRSPFLALRFSSGVQTGPDSILKVRLHHDSYYRKAVIGRFRIALSSGQYSWPESGDAGLKTHAKPVGASTLTFAAERGLPSKVANALKKSEDDRTMFDNEVLRAHFQWSTPELQPLLARIAALNEARRLLEAEIPEVVVTEATTPRQTRILPRADWMNETSEIVQPAVPEFLGKLDTGGQRATRLDLANWIVSAGNPLTPRVIVNRMWREFFGIGITKALDDFGSQGEWPSNPDLLEWLASEFVQPTVQADGAHAWDIRHTMRLIVTSHAYRQSSLSNPAIDESDPGNRLLAHQSRFLIDAELVRDTALSISGLLVEKFGGPSVNPYEPAGYLAAMNFPKREYSASRGDDLYRRGVYTGWQRTFLHPSLATFDAPTREECAINRVNSNTPLQALVLLNDPTFVEAARVFAENILKQGGRTIAPRIDWAFEQAINRKPRPQESRILADLYRKSRARFRASPPEAKKFISVGEAPLPPKMDSTELAAMTSVARAILNLHETITRN